MKITWEDELNRKLRISKEQKKIIKQNVLISKDNKKSKIQTKP